MCKTQKFTPLEKTTDFNRWSSLFKANGGQKPLSAQAIRERGSLMGFILLFLFFIVFLTTPFSLTLKAENNSAFAFDEEVIVIDNGFEYKITNNGGRIEEVLENAGVKIQKEDIIFPSREAVLKTGTNIIIERAVPVVFNTHGKEKEIFVKKEITVGEAMKEGGIEFKKDDLIDIDFAAQIFPGMEIKIWQKPGPKPKPKPLPAPKIVKTGESQIGAASWYSYIPGNFCASTTFKKGTNLLVTNLQNGKSVVVKVNDSGPFNQRVIDLEKNAFSRIASSSKGVIRVKVEKLGN